MTQTAPTWEGFLERFGKFTTYRHNELGIGVTEIDYDTFRYVMDYVDHLRSYCSTAFSSGWKARDNDCYPDTTRSVSEHYADFLKELEAKNAE